MELIQSKKVELIKWLRGDEMLLQYVDQAKILTMDEYNTIKNIQDPSKQITELVDKILSKGDTICYKFLRLLAKDEVNEFRPMLRKWIRQIEDKIKAPAKKTAKRKAGEMSTEKEEKDNKGAGNDTAPKKRRKAEPGKPKASAKKAGQPKAEKPKTPKRTAKPKTDKPKTPTKKTKQPKTVKPKASAKKAGQPKAEKPKTPKRTTKPKTDKPKTPTKKTTQPKTGGTQRAKPSRKCARGYIHNVSKVMLSANKYKYFTALFQEAKTCSKLVVFKEEHHQEYVTAEKNRTPVKLENIKYERQHTGKMDIIARWDSKLSSLKKLPFSFDATKKQETNAEHKTIRSIRKKNINHQVHVTVKIKKQLEKGTKMTKANKECEMTEYKVSDKGGSLNLTVWGKNNLSVGKWYLLQNLSVGEYQGKATLSTTTQTTIKEVEEPGAAAKAESSTDATNEGLNEVGTSTGAEQENNMA